VEAKEYFGRIEVSEKWPFPKAAAEPQRFHHVYWTKKVKPGDNWQGMTIKARETHFHNFLFHLSTLDPYQNRMQPGVGSEPLKRNNASWRGFWLSDGELEALVRETFAV
jgi:hypothetical protein